jgi:hypothetical protein
MENSIEINSEWDENEIEWNLFLVNCRKSETQLKELLDFLNKDDLKKLCDIANKSETEVYDYIVHNIKNLPENIQDILMFYYRQWMYIKPIECFGDEFVLNILRSMDIFTEELGILFFYGDQRKDKEQYWNFLPKVMNLVHESNIQYKKKLSDFSPDNFLDMFLGSNAMEVYPLGTALWFSILLSTRFIQARFFKFKYLFELNKLPICEKLKRYEENFAHKNEEFMFNMETSVNDIRDKNPKLQECIEVFNIICTDKMAFRIFVHDAVISSEGFQNNPNIMLSHFMGILKSKVDMRFDFFLLRKCYIESSVKKHDHEIFYLLKESVINTKTSGEIEILKKENINYIQPTLERLTYLGNYLNNNLETLDPAYYKKLVGTNIVDKNNPFAVYDLMLSNSNYSPMVSVLHKFYFIFCNNDEEFFKRMNLKKFNVTLVKEKILQNIFSWQEMNILFNIILAFPNLNEDQKQTIQEYINELKVLDLHKNNPQIPRNNKPDVPNKNDEPNIPTPYVRKFIILAVAISLILCIAFSEEISETFQSIIFEQ